ncbi:IclR family transcriptional regulator [Ferrovibrio terrae]|uniref:IclR family transcriptional regulator n=1 Tax=Ferrovibrio terrae TaxID=2594003 RepID=UPI00313844E6
MKTLKSPHSRGLSEPKPSAGSQSLERGLDILAMIDSEDGGLGVREIARRMTLSPTIVQRLVTSLSNRGYVEKNQDTSRYVLGYKALAMGGNRANAMDYIATAKRELEQLSKQHRLNGFVAALRGFRAIYLLAVQADGPISINVKPGSEMPLHSTGAGKVLLASLAEDDVRKLLSTNKLKAFTPHTITDVDRLVASLAKIRRTDIATVSEENIPGVLSVAAPIRDKAGHVIAALSVAFPKYVDASRTLQTVAPLVAAAAQRVSQALGWQPGNTKLVK